MLSVNDTRLADSTLLKPDNCISQRVPGIAADASALRIGFLSNRLSGRNQGRGVAATHRVLLNHPHVAHHEVTTPSEIAQALDDLARQPVDLVAISGGDGTVQATLTALLNQGSFEKPPLLAILPSGTTNMTAGDVGLRGNRGRALRRLLAWASSPGPGVRIVERPVLRVQPAPGRPAVYGMFFGAAGIVQGIRFCRDEIHTRGLGGEIGPGLALARLAFDALRGRSEHLAAERAGISLDGRPAEQGKYLLALVSTLERLFLGLRPYWGMGEGPLHYTAVRAGPRHLLRLLPRALRGHRHHWLTEENGYASDNVDEVRLFIDSSFTVDGEIYPTDSQAGPVVVGDGGRVSFVRL